MRQLHQSCGLPAGHCSNRHWENESNWRGSSPGATLHLEDRADHSRLGAVYQNCCDKVPLILMRQNIVLIDFENVQPDKLSDLVCEQFRVLVFVGAQQHKVPFETAASLQSLGSRAEYVKITGNGTNALDFHMAFYLGQLAAADASACFHLVTKDTGFDPLIAHLQAKGIKVRRVTELGEIPVIKAARAKLPRDRVELYLAHLRRPGAPRPRTVKTLRNSLGSFFYRQLSEADLDAVLEELGRVGAITLAETKVVYAFE